ncbi:MAG: DEAD/DEAH box helicase [Anaerolineae bacterium]|nr:DEAD/DEAH box helicase [Anaerolineae bacterium]
MTNPFYRLSPFIQEFIYREKWQALKGFQVETIEAVLDTSDHILITSGTASGKTEAAFLPILTELHERPSATIGAMYVGPLKALINDQFYRLDTLLEEGDLPVQGWHGDISQNKKLKFLKRAQGVLQITPESLEAMLINRQIELSRLFGDLRYVVIDEVHAFIGSDRGRQVMCQLQRLARYQAKPARRIGLSATLGEPGRAMEWLAGGTDYGVVHINDSQKGRQVQLGLEHFIVAGDDEDEPEDTTYLEDTAEAPIDENLFEPSDGDLPEQSFVDQSEDLFQHMYGMVQSVRKTLVFGNSRNDTEEIIQNLRRLAGVETEDEDGYYVHHGSISAALRERAEEDMRDPTKQACVAATLTLELGIDLGSLDQVLQLNATSTVSSFVQRLGRSGRRGTAAKMFFYSREEDPGDSASLGKRIPWILIQTIAIIQLYLEQKWVEPPEIPVLPLSLLYHQTMSSIRAQTELSPPDLAERVLTLSPFASVTLDQYRVLLRYLLEADHLERMEGSGLIIGHAAERMVNDYHFYATFEDKADCQVREGTREIGTIQSMPIVGDRFRLAGRSWQVLSVDEEKRIIQVERVKGKASAAWMGGGASVHSQILQRMRQVLEEESDYGYLQERALVRLDQARRLARTSRLTSEPILPLGGNKFMLLPWQGTKIMHTIDLLLTYAGVNVETSGRPYYLVVNAANEDELRSRISDLVQNVPDPQAIIAPLKVFDLMVNKYDRYVPEELLREAYINDQMDVPGALSVLARLIE